MTRIAVSSNSLVDYSQDRWRLIQIDDSAEPKLVLEAIAGAPLRFNGYFAVSRDLPEAREILKADLGQVVLGWSSESESWQLGMTLSPEISLARSSRWFEVLRFTNSDPDVFQKTATQLGKALARTLDIPFVSSELDVEEAPEPEPIPLVDLPLELGMWRLQPALRQGGSDGELELRRDKRWLQSKLRQIAWYGFWAAVYLGVSIATLTSELGLPIAGTLIPNPAWLPVLGIAVAVLLILMILRQVWIILREPDAMTINPWEKTISARRGGGQLWRVNAGAVQSVYASEVLKKRGRRHTVFHGEINLHLLDGSFMPVLVNSDKITDGLLAGMDALAEKNRADGVNLLEPAEVATALQAAAVHIALNLGELPVWYDRRLR
ncbi:MAG: hypothetical protein OXG68_02150 [Chloroflexi bacterium]|nr:hypothetical protein [Chloroflexota bacterium]